MPKKRPATPLNWSKDVRSGADDLGYQRAMRRIAAGNYGTDDPYDTTFQGVLDAIPADNNTPYDLRHLKLPQALSGANDQQGGLEPAKPAWADSLQLPPMPPPLSAGGTPGFPRSPFYQPPSGNAYRQAGVRQGGQSAGPITSQPPLGVRTPIQPTLAPTRTTAPSSPMQTPPAGAYGGYDAMFQTPSQAIARPFARSVQGGGFIPAASQLQQVFPNMPSRNAEAMAAAQREKAFAAAERVGSDWQGLAQRRTAAERDPALRGGNYDWTQSRYFQDAMQGGGGDVARVDQMLAQERAVDPARAGQLTDFWTGRPTQLQAESNSPMAANYVNAQFPAGGITPESTNALALGLGHFGRETPRAANAAESLRNKGMTSTGVAWDDTDADRKRSAEIAARAESNPAYQRMNQKRGEDQERYTLARAIQRMGGGQQVGPMSPEVVSGLNQVLSGKDEPNLFQARLLGGPGAAQQQMFGNREQGMMDLERGKVKAAQTQADAAMVGAKSKEDNEAAVKEYEAWLNANKNATEPQKDTIRKRIQTRHGASPILDSRLSPQAAPTAANVPMLDPGKRDAAGLSDWVSSIPDTNNPEVLQALSDAGVTAEHIIRAMRYNSPREWGWGQVPLQGLKWMGKSLFQGSQSVRDEFADYESKWDKLQQLLEAIDPEAAQRMADEYNARYGQK